MQKPVCLFAVLLLISCENSRYSNLESISFETTEIECVDKVAAGGIQTQRIDTREEFDSLVYFKYTVPLEEWLDNNYDFLTDGVILNYPDATPDEYDSIILNEYVYNFAPFSWTKDCTLPEIDFDKYTLLGKGICAGGCSMPGIENQVYLEDNALIFNTNITTYGSCEMLICINAWILVDKLDKDCEVIFKTETVNQEYSVN